MKVMDKVNEKIREESGFTILHTMVAISILTFGLLAIASMQTFAMQMNLKANRLTEATTIGQDTLEQLLVLPDDDANLEEGEHLLPEVNNGPYSYTVTWDVEVNNPIDNASLITVIVQWQDKGVVRSTELSSIRPRI